MDTGVRPGFIQIPSGPRTLDAGPASDDFPTVPVSDASTAQVTDAELVERARAGDHAAFGVLVDRYQHVVVRAARAVVGRGEEAEDVAQDALLKAFRHIDRFRGEASVKTWLLAITWRHALSHRRSIAARMRRFVTADERFDPPATARLQDQALADVELQRSVARVVRTLPAKYREALMLFATGDHTFDEMSQALGVPAGTLKWRVSEARRRLKEKLERLGVTT
jgi:RNA polymerase sigma-70 factor (ECF subfamily)